MDGDEGMVTPRGIYPALTVRAFILFMYCGD